MSSRKQIKQQQEKQPLPPASSQKQSDNTTTTPTDTTAAVSSGEKAAALFLTIFVAIVGIYLFSSQEFTALKPSIHFPTFNLLHENAFLGAWNRAKNNQKVLAAQHNQQQQDPTQ